MITSYSSSTAGKFARRAFIILLFVCVLASMLSAVNAANDIPTATVTGGTIDAQMTAFDGDGYVYIIGVPAGTAQKDENTISFKIDNPGIKPSDSDDDYAALRLIVPVGTDDFDYEDIKADVVNNTVSFSIYNHQYSPVEMWDDSLSNNQQFLKWRSTNFYAFRVKLNNDDETTIGILVYEKSNAPEPSLTEKQKKPLVDVLKTVTGDNEKKWYQTGDRYNGNKADTITDRKSGFWAEFTKPNGPRATAQGVLDTATTTEQITNAVTELETAIKKLIPKTELNATKLYELLQDRNYSDVYLASCTAPSAENFLAARGAAQTYLDSLFNKDGSANTAVNLAANQKTMDGYVDALKGATLVFNEQVDEARNSQRTIQALAKVYAMTENDGKYTEDSWQTFVQARSKATEFAAKHVVSTAITDKEVKDYAKLMRAFLAAAYHLTPAQDNVTVTFSYTDDLHLRVPQPNDPYKSMVDPAGNKPQIQNVTLPRGATLADLLAKTGYTSRDSYYGPSEYSVWHTFVKGRMLYAVPTSSEKDVTDMEYVLKDGDEIQFVHMDWPANVFNIIYRAKLDWTGTTKILNALHFKETGAQTAAAGTETTLTVERTSAHLWSWDGEYTPYEGATIAAYGPKNDDGSYPETPILSETTSDANGSVTFKLYQEGEYIVTAYDARPNDEDNSVYYSGTVAAPYLTLTVGGAADPDAVNAELKAELDKVYNAYPKKIFSAEAWNTIETAYNNALAVLNDPDATTGKAYLAQKDAIRTIQAKQTETLQANKTAIETFRRYLNQLPDNPELITESVKQAAQDLVNCYTCMTDYQRSLITSAEQAKYDRIKAYLDKLGEAWPTAKKYKLELKVKADTPEATAALESMIADLRDHPAKMDRAQGGKYDQTQAINIVTPYTFGTYAGDNSTMLFSETFAEADPLTPVRLYTNVDYAAYFQTRNANGTYTTDGTWSINDDDLRIVQSRIGTTTVPGEYKAEGLTVKVGNVAYEIKSITYEGLSKSDVVSGTQRVYDDSGYKGKATDVVNVDIPDAYLGFAMPYNDVTVTITWGRVDGTDDEIATEKANALKILEAEHAKYADITDAEKRAKIDQAYEAGWNAINAARSVTAIRSERASAVTAMMKAAAGTDASYANKIEGWGADERDPFDAGLRVGSVTVIMENSTCDGSTLKDPTAQEAAKFFHNNGKPFVYETNYPLGQNDSAMTVVLRALKDNEFNWNGTGGADFGITYLASITKNSHTLAEFTCGGSSGWMCTLNDFFCNRSLSEFRVNATDPNYSLTDGDVIHVMYTTTGFGSDLGGSWYDSNTTLESLVVEGGDLTSTFVSGEAGGSYDYTLLIDDDSANIALTPTAANKNYLVRTYLNVKDTGAEEGDMFYNRGASIPVAAGDVIYVGCGEFSWPSMNNQETEARMYSGTWYALHVVSKSTGGEDVKAQIDALPDSLAYGDHQSYERDITAARAAYKALSNDEAREKVTNLDKLERLEEQLKSYQEIDDFKQRIETLPEDNQVTLDHKEAVDKASRIYNDYLTPEQKQYLTPAELQKLQELQARLDELAAEKVISAIDALEPVTKESGAAIKAARDAYNKLTDAQKKLVTNYDKLTAAEARWSELNPIPAGQPAQLPQNPNAGETLPFTDVNANSWYYSGVKFAYEKGLMNGTGNGTFSPNADTTRGMIVTMLARLEGQNTSGTPWYAAGQKWAMDNGISDGTNMTGAITREQLAAILFRYAKQKGYDVSKSADLNGFADANTVSGYATDAMRWAVANGLIQGSNSKLSPKATASRAQVATILMRFMELYAK